MIEITLKELSESIGALERIGNSLKAENMKYRFARVIKKVKAENEIIVQRLGGIAEKHGARVPGEGQFDFALREEDKDNHYAIDDQKNRIEAFNREVSHFMKHELIQLPFDPKYFTWEEFKKAEPSDAKEKSSASDLANILWLVSDEGMDKESPADAAKAQAAGA